MGPPIGSHVTSVSAQLRCRTRGLLHILPLLVTAPKGLGPGREGVPPASHRGPVITIRGSKLPDSRAPRISTDEQAQVSARLHVRYLLCLAVRPDLVLCRAEH